MKKLKLTLAALAITTLGFSQVNLINGLRACYPMDCDSAKNFAPATVGTLNGVLSNITCAPGHNNVTNTGLRFAGDSLSYIALPSNVNLKPSPALSFGCWVQSGVAATQYILFTHNTCGSNHEGYALLIDDAGTGTYHYQVVKADGSCSQVYLTGSAVASTNGTGWQHVGFYLGNDSIKIYVNGVPDAQSAIGVNFSYGAFDKVYFGGTRLAYNKPFKGVLDNARFYNRKLNNQEFYALFNNDPGCRSEARPVGINETIAEDDNSFIYPNPSNGSFYVSNENGSSFSIIDITGKDVQHTVTKINESTSQVNLNQTAAGFYFVKFYNASGKVTKTSKIVVTH